ncbi:MAG: hypothetical protein OHK0024_29450 [Thalassobaculales bacterium]
MSINISLPKQPELKPRITVIGVGGAGGNAVNNMIRSALEGVEFVVANTDAQALNQSVAERKIQLGPTVTQGLGAGARPEIGRAAAEDSIEELLSHLDGSNMVFITAGMGGGTGTGAAPVIAQACKERNILTVGVVTKPFQFEGAHRMRLADAGIEQLQQYVDTLIIIPNQNLFRLANEKTTFADAFKMADDVLHAGVRGVTDLMVMPGLINLDFADIRSVMSEMGKAMMGTGESEGDKRATLAAESAINNPLLEDTSMKGARGVLIHITGGYDLTLFEVDEACNRIRQECDADANIIFGSTFDERLAGRLRVSVVATGIESEAAVARPPRPEQKVVAFGPRATAAAAPSVREAMAAAPAPFFGAAAPAIDAVSQPTALRGEPELARAPEMPASQPAPLPQVTAPAAPAAQAMPAEPSPAVAAMMRAEQQAAPPLPRPPVDKAGAFIPPAPATASKAPPVAEPVVPAQGSNLFRKVFGSLGGGTPRSPAEPALREPVLGTPGAKEPPAAARAVAPQPAAPQPAARPAAPRLDIDRPRSQSEEDLLEIPAFLRRQAN